MNPARSVLVVVVVILAAVTASIARADEAAGKVVSATGEPVSGAVLVVTSGGAWVFPNAPPEQRTPDDKNSATATTDKDGAFKIRIPENAGEVAAFHSTLGYAELTPKALAEQPTVKLEAWCRVEGVVKLGRKSLGGATVQLTNRATGNSPKVRYGYDVVADAQGRYAFDRVPAGVAAVSIRPTPDSSPVTRFTFAVPGKPARLDVGGTGRPVVGKIVMVGDREGDLNDLNGYKPGSTSTNIENFRRDVPYPYRSGVQEHRVPKEKLAARDRAWQRSEEAGKLFATQHIYDVHVNTDGSFRFDDVPPGAYKLNIVFHRGGVDRNDPEDNIRQDVIVPEDPADSPLDLGELRIGKEGL